MCKMGVCAPTHLSLVMSYNCNWQVAVMAGASYDANASDDALASSDALAFYDAFASYDKRRSFLKHLLTADYQAYFSSPIIM